MNIVFFWKIQSPVSAVNIVDISKTSYTNKVPEIPRHGRLRGRPVADGSELPFGDALTRCPAVLVGAGGMREDLPSHFVF